SAATILISALSLHDALPICSRGGLSTKINAIVDQAGMPVHIVLSQGQSSDKTVAPPLIEAVEPGRDLVADRGYDARALIDLVERDRKSTRLNSSHVSS